MIQLIAYPQGTNFNAGGYIDSTILDLYDNEPIPLVLNADDFTNVAENTASYSRPMKLPGTKINNKFFTFIYDVVSDSNFNPHLKTSIVLKDNSINIFEGYMQLNDILIKDEVISYDITLYSEVVQLKDILSDKLISDIDFYEIATNYDKNVLYDAIDVTIGTKLNLPISTSDSFAGALGATHTSVIRYPITKWNTNPTVNPGGGGSWSLSEAWDGYRPWINCLYIINRIFRDAGYSFTSTFMNSPAFNKLYNDVNTETGVAKVEIYCTNPNTTKVYDNTWRRLEYNTANASSNFNPANYYNTTLFQFDNYSAANFFGVLPDSMIPLVIVGTAQVQLRYTNTTTGQVWTDTAVTYSNGGILFENGMGFYAVAGLPGEIIVQEVRTIGAGQTFTVAANAETNWSNTTDVIDFNNILVNSDKGNLSQWDYFKGFIDMYKLIIIQDTDNPTNLIIEPYINWVDAGLNTHDLTNKVDIKEIKYNPIAGLNKRLIFRNVEDADDWITLNHNHPNDWKYAYNFIPNIEIFDKEEEIIQVNPFAATYCKPLADVIPQIFAPCIVNNDTNLTTWNNVFRVLYDNGNVTIPGGGRVYVSSGMWPVNNRYIYNQFASVNSYPINSTTDGLNFGLVHYHGWGSGTVLNSLYTVYYSRYIDELYHKDTKIATILVNLNSSDISKIKFNDKVLIKNKKYRIRKIEYRPGAISKMELLTIKDL